MATFSSLLLTAIDSAIAGKTAAVAKPIYTPLEPATFNTSRWCSAIDLSCQAVANGNTSIHGIGYVAIAPDILISATHAMPAHTNGVPFGYNKDFYFKSPTTGTLYLRHSDFACTVGDSDHTLVKLTSDLPAAIPPMVILPENWALYITNAGTGLPAIRLNQDLNASIVDVNSIPYALNASVLSVDTPTDPARLEFFQTIRSGDSGYGIFWPGLSRLIGIGNVSGLLYHYFKSDINATMTTLGSSYELEEADFSALDMGTYSVSIQGNPTTVVYGSTVTIIYDTTGAAGDSAINVTSAGGDGLSTPVTGLPANTSGTTSLDFGTVALGDRRLRMSDEIEVEAYYPGELTTFEIVAAPLTAGILSSSSRTTTSITLAWTAPSGGTAPITAQLQKSPAGAGSWTNVAGATSSPGTASGLTFGADYNFRVAFTDDAAVTVYSNIVTAGTGMTNAMKIALGLI